MFLESESKGNPQMLPLPLPWNRTYKTNWANFIGSVAGRYGTNPTAGVHHRRGTYFLQFRNDPAERDE